MILIHSDYGHMLYVVFLSSWYANVKWLVFDDFYVYVCSSIDAQFLIEEGHHSQRQSKARFFCKRMYT